MLPGILNIAKSLLGGIIGGNPLLPGNDSQNTPFLQFSQNAIPSGELMKSFIA